MKTQEVKEDKKITKREQTIVGLGCLLPVVLIALFFWSLSSAREANKPNYNCNDDRVIGGIISEKMVADHLLYPSSSHVFNELERGKTFSCSGNVFHYTGLVDAANALGVKRQVGYTIQLEYLGGDKNANSSWKEISFQFLD